MTNVNSTPPPQEMTAESADPPTIKNAGRLSTDYDFAAILGIVAMLAILVGGLVLAVMASHRRLATGAVIYGVVGLGSLAVMTASTAMSNVGYENLLEVVSYLGVPVGVSWLVLGAIALVVGSVVRPTAKRQDTAAF